MEYNIIWTGKKWVWKLDIKYKEMFKLEYVLAWTITSNPSKQVENVSACTGNKYSTPFSKRN